MDRPRRRTLSRREFLGLLGSVPILVTLPSGVVVAAALQVRRVRSWTAPDHTRIVVELGAPARFETRAYQDPARVVLEIPNSIAEALTIPVDDGTVRRIVVDPTIPGTTLVRIELERGSEFEAFPLAPNAGGEAHRIVIDVQKQLTPAELDAQEREQERIRTSGDIVVAIDAGHGGNDPGCVARIAGGGYLYEKDVALDVARQLSAALAGRPRLRGVLTRDKDYFVPLGRRQQLAEKYGAKLFVSIHVNSAPSNTARGSEVWIVSLKGAADKAAKELVDRENAADEVGGLTKQQTQGPLVEILVNMRYHNSIRQSERFAEIVTARLEQVPGNENRGLRQGPFAVLKSISCPSVLVELGFITNARDVRMLSDAAMRRQYAEHLAAAVEEYARSAG